MIRSAEAADRARVEALLNTAELPVEGVADHFDRFFVIDEGPNRGCGRPGALRTRCSAPVSSRRRRCAWPGAWCPTDPARARRSSGARIACRVVADDDDRGVLPPVRVSPDRTRRRAACSSPVLRVAGSISGFRDCNAAKPVARLPAKYAGEARYLSVTLRPLLRLLRRERASGRPSEVRLAREGKCGGPPGVRP